MSSLWKIGDGSVFSVSKVVAIRLRDNMDEEEKTDCKDEWYAQAILEGGYMLSLTRDDYEDLVKYCATSADEIERDLEKKKTAFGVVEKLQKALGINPELLPGGGGINVGDLRP